MIPAKLEVLNELEAVIQQNLDAGDWNPLPPELERQLGLANFEEVTMTDAAKHGVEFLAHYGVKGMRWGVRKDRSPTEVGAEATQTLLRGKAKVKTTGGTAQPASADAVKAATTKQILKKSGTAALSNQQLRELQERMQLEVNVRRLDAETATGGKKFVKKALGENAKRVASQEVASTVDRVVKEAKNRK